MFDIVSKAKDKSNISSQLVLNTNFNKHIKTFIHIDWVGVTARVYEWIYGMCGRRGWKVV